MTNDEKLPLDYLLHSCNELRSLLLAHPDLPLLVFASDDCNTGDYSYMSCGQVHAEIGEVLNCRQTVNDEILYCDRENFENDLREQEEDAFDGDDKEFDIFIEKKLDEYEPYWTPCIILYVGN